MKRHLADLGRETPTIRKTIVALASTMKRAKDQGLIHENPFAGQAKGKTQSRKKRIYTPDEIDAMLAVCPSLWWRTFLRLAVVTLQELSLQSGGSRYVFLSLARLRLLDARLQAGKRLPRKYVCNLNREFDQIQELAHLHLAKSRGLKPDKLRWERGTPHDLRRTFCSLLAPHVDQFTLTKWAGHSDPRVTAEFYHEVQTATAVAARQALSAGRAIQDTIRTQQDSASTIQPVDCRQNSVPDSMRPA